MTWVRQRTSRHRFTYDRSHREPKRGKILSHRVHLWHQVASLIWNLYQVSCLSSDSAICLPFCRCPTECKLSHSNSPWKCVVKLHFSTDARGVPITVKVVPFGGPITSKTLVEDRIQRAQRAILNPSKDPNTYLHQNNLPDENEISFSQNYVSLEISGSELTDLSFVDLPGLIASVGAGGNERDIELVKSLVLAYIEKPSCVILLTVACESQCLRFVLDFGRLILSFHQPTSRTKAHIISQSNTTQMGSEPSVSPYRSSVPPFSHNHSFMLQQVSSPNPIVLSQVMSQLGSGCSETKPNLWLTTGTASSSPLRRTS